MTKTKTSYENEVITETVITSDMLTGLTIGTLQEDYLLSEADFLRLKSNQSSLTAWAFNFFFATIGYAISILPKWLAELAGKSEQITKSEWTTLVIGIGITVALYVIGLILPNEKKNTMKKIESHFINAPKSRQLFRGKE